MVCEPRFCETPVSVPLDIICARHIMLSDGLQPGNPPPGKRVRSRIAICQMPQEKIRTQLPRQTQRKYPNTGKPHTCVIVEIAGALQFMDPIIKAFYACFAITCSCNAVDCLCFEIFKLGQIIVPDRRALLQPALPICPPEYLLNELFCIGRAMFSQHSSNHFLLGNNPVADVGRQHRNVIAAVRPKIETALLGILPAGTG